jgi:hypothetical protein
MLPDASAEHTHEGGLSGTPFKGHDHDQTGFASIDIARPHCGRVRMTRRLQGAALEQAIGELAQGLVPTARAEIVFNRDDLNGAVRDVLVIDRDARLPRGSGSTSSGARETLGRHSRIGPIARCRRRYGAG